MSIFQKSSKVRGQHTSVPRNRMGICKPCRALGACAVTSLELHGNCVRRAESRLTV